MSLVKYFVIALCAVYVSCASTRLEPIEHRSVDESSEETGRSQSGPDISSGIKVLIRAYEQCDGNKDTFQCLKGKALKFVDRALQVENIPLIEGLALVKTDKDATAARALTDEDIEDPKTVDGLLVDRMSRFISSHSLQLNMPKITENAKELFDEQGRGHKLKKLMGPLLMGLMMKGGMVALAFKAVALLAGKALLVAKIALVLAAVIGLSKLAGGKESKVSYEIVKHPHVQHAHSHSSSVVHEGHGGGGWESGASSGGHGGWDLGGGGGGGSGGHFRSLDVSQSEFVPHVMAYRGQISQEQANGVDAKQ